MTSPRVTQGIVAGVSPARTLSDSGTHTKEGLDAVGPPLGSLGPLRRGYIDMATLGGILRISVKT